jgi:DNA mismatch endonuclease (patch repair protein)
MSRVRGKNTKPELVVRRLVFSLGYRYRLHRSDLPGKPDLVFAGKKKIIFVHGCFWHVHCCNRFSMPKSNVDFWTEKLAANEDRDRRNQRKLTSLGWHYMVIWECQLLDLEELKAQIVDFLES